MWWNRRFLFELTCVEMTPLCGSSYRKHKLSATGPWRIQITHITQKMNQCCSSCITWRSVCDPDDAPPPPHHPWHQVDSFCYRFGWHRYITTPTHHNFQFHPWASISKDVCIIIHRLLHQSPRADSRVQPVHIQYGSTTKLPVLLINRW